MPDAPRVDVGRTTVTWCGGGLFIERGGVGLVLDAPTGVERVLARRLGDVHTKNSLLLFCPSMACLALKMITSTR